MAKGLELPVNVLVIVAIAIVILLALILIFSAGVNPITYLIAGSAKSAGCNTLAQRGCDDPSAVSVNYDVNGDKKTVLADDNLQTLCESVFSCPTGKPDCCKALCGCGTKKAKNEECSINEECSQGLVCKAATTAGTATGAKKVCS